ncbi:hypothetical protein CALVIDRAFT_601272 [Calocera viscosa TUFC12733]|uniref:C2H2-type domain-containing protein n=1 Tax=Calocera viscosa (strain TUFC12733) TaxID=1330018 RepID=A0A167INX1_CALVF|nr:hypothetical protein CALVIDRAFT_601272 [Calocera viscosa TUFC12733]
MDTWAEDYLASFVPFGPPVIEDTHPHLLHEWDHEEGAIEPDMSAHQEAIFEPGPALVSDSTSAVAHHVTTPAILHSSLIDPTILDHPAFGLAEPNDAFLNPLVSFNDLPSPSPLSPQLQLRLNDLLAELHKNEQVPPKVQLVDPISPSEFFIQLGSSKHSLPLPIPPFVEPIPITPSEGYFEDDSAAADASTPALDCSPTSWSTDPGVVAEQDGSRHARIATPTDLADAQEPSDPVSSAITSKENGKSSDRTDVVIGPPILVTLCGYPKPGDQSYTCGAYVAGTQGLIRHRFSHVLDEYHAVREGAMAVEDLIFGGHDSRIPFCKDCDRKFTRASSLKRHRLENCPKEVKPNQPAWLLSKKTSSPTKYHWVPTPKDRPRDAMVKLAKPLKAAPFVSEIVEVRTEWAPRYVIPLKGKAYWKDDKIAGVAFLPEGSQEGTAWYQKQSDLEQLAVEFATPRGSGIVATLKGTIRTKRKHDSVEDRDDADPAERPIKKLRTSRKGKGKETIPSTKHEDLLLSAVTKSSPHTTPIGLQSGYCQSG